MKITTPLLLAALSFFLSPAVKADENCPLPIMVVVNESEALSESNVSLLTNKMEAAVTHLGFGGTELAPLYITGKAVELNKSAIAGTRPVVTTQLEIYMTVGNLINENEKFGTFSLTVDGAGNNEAQATQNALAKINAHNESLQKFLTKTRAKVFSYYQAHVPGMVKQARAMAERGDYTKALYSLSTIPPCCGDYELVEQAIIDVWQKYLDVDCAAKLAQAKSIWFSGQNEEAARKAAALIAAIDRRSACSDEADALLQTIADFVGESNARKLALEDAERLRQDEDREFAREMARAEIDLRRRQIEAIRDLSLSFASDVIGKAADRLKGNDTPAADRDKSPVVIINNR